MQTITPNYTGVNASDLLQSRNTKTRQTITDLNMTASSGGGSDYISHNTPDVKGMLGLNRSIQENSVHMLNTTKINSRSQGQIEFIRLCQNISVQLGVKLCDMRTDKGLLDQTFHSWCSEQLSNIARMANAPMFDGTYACASGTVTIPPINPSTITTPLSTGAGPTLDYSVGAFNGFNARLSASSTWSDSYNVTSNGTENLIRALRVCLTGNIALSRDPTWAFANDLLVNGANPNLALDLQLASDLGHQAQDTESRLKDLIPIYGGQFQSYAFLPETQIIQQKIQEASKAKQQESSLFANLKHTQDFFHKMDQLD